MTFTTPSLIRQNAFHLARNQVRSPFDPICDICFEYIKSNEQLLRPCRCQTEYQTVFYAHKDCFISWLKENEYPKKCTSCNETYAITLPRPYNWIKFAFFTLLLIFVFYFAFHLKRCITIEEVTKSQLFDFHGEATFNNVPDKLVLPRISKSCVKNFYQSFSNHFISITDAFFIVVISSICSFVLTRLI